MQKKSIKSAVKNLIKARKPVDKSVAELKAKLKQAGEMFAWAESIGLDYEMLVRDIKPVLEKVMEVDPAKPLPDRVRDQVGDMLAQIKDLNSQPSSCPCKSCKSHRKGSEKSQC